MKICIITPQYKKISNGVGTYAKILIEGLIKKGYEVSIICPESDIIDKRVKIITIKEIFDPSGWILMSYKFAKKIKNRNFDLIHFVDARNALFFKENAPVIGTVHDYYSAIASKNPLLYKQYYNDWIKRWFYYNLVNFLERFSLKKLDGVISVCKATGEKVKKVYGLKEYKVIYNGVNLVKINRKKEEDIILFVGGNFQRKGLGVLIKSAPSIIKEFPNIKFYIVGSDKNEAILKKLCKEMDVEKNFNFCGNLDKEKLEDLYCKSKIFVMPSLIESFAFVFLESMNYGIPIIGGNVGGTKELIKDGKNGFLVNKNNINELSRKIILLLKNEKLRENFRKEGYKTIKKFSAEKMVNETLDFYKKVLFSYHISNKTK